MIPSSVRAICFDAVGTLIHPSPPAAEVYAKVGRQYGSQLTVEEIRKRFNEVYSHLEDLDREIGWRTSEEHEVRRWYTIVTTVLKDSSDPQVCFEELYFYFAQPQAWQCTPNVQRILSALHDRGYRLAVASNFDHRLRTVLAGLPELALLENIIISAEIGWRKPANAFFEAICATLKTSPNETLYIGDDWSNDYQGALAAGLHARLLSNDRGNENHLESLDDLLQN